MPPSPSERAISCSIGSDGFVTTPVSLLACGGGLPRDVAEVLRRQQRPVNIVAIAGMADADYTGFNVTTVGIGCIGALLSALRRDGVEDLVIAGHARRPDLARLRIDFGFIRNFTTVYSLTRGGDDHVMRRIAAFFESAGFRVLSIADVAPELLTPKGNLTGQACTPSELAGARSGLAALRTLGPYDVGQALVVEGGRIIAIEGAEGTNGLIKRVAERSPHAPVGVSSSAAVDKKILIKAAKPGQELRLDLPTIGVETVEHCARAGIGSIVVEEARTLIVARQETVGRAESLGVTIQGISAVSTGLVETEASQPKKTAKPLTGLTRARPTKRDLADATKGLHLMRDLGPHADITAILVARRNVLAIGAGEPLSEFLARTEQLAQWDDRRHKTKRNRTLIVRSATHLPLAHLRQLATSKIAGIAIAEVCDKPADIDDLVAAADDMNLFVMRTA